MQNYHLIPKGEPGSINDLTKRALVNDDIDGVAFEVANNANISISVIYNVERYGGKAKALFLAAQIIKLISNDH